VLVAGEEGDVLAVPDPHVEVHPETVEVLDHDPPRRDALLVHLDQEVLGVELALEPVLEAEVDVRAAEGLDQPLVIQPTTLIGFLPAAVRSALSVSRVDFMFLMKEKAGM